MMWDETRGSGPEIEPETYEPKCEYEMGGHGSKPELYHPYDLVDPTVAAAAAEWLRHLGYGLTTEHTRLTPHRLSWYVMTLLGQGYKRDIHVTTFENIGRMSDAVVLPDIPIWSACSHHLLPFHGTVDFGYIPGDRIIGLSKVPLVVQQVARGPWMQEDLTSALADKFFNETGAVGVIVRTDCIHTCVMLDMGTAAVPRTVLCALRGIYAHNPYAKEEFMQHLQLQRSR